jgi:segregation and condensation protein A
MTDTIESFEAKEAEPEPERLVVDVDGYEGPIDVLLTLAREQKVDLKRISILALVEQYLVFVQTARRLRLELAADYLVIAAWLAYLKSRLLLPEPPDDDEPTGEELAAELTFQLERLQAMQTAAVRLMARAQLGLDCFPRGQPEDLRVRKRPVFDVTLYDLMSAYGDQRAREEGRTLHIAPTELYAVEQALERLQELVGRNPDWQMLTSFLPAALKDGLVARSALAATFVASLELAREGKLQLRQLERFGPIYLRPMRSTND